MAMTGLPVRKTVRRVGLCLGVVQAFDAGTCRYRVEFEDGTDEVLTPEEVDELGTRGRHAKRKRRARGATTPPPPPSRRAARSGRGGGGATAVEGGGAPREGGGGAPAAKRARATTPVPPARPPPPRPHGARGAGGAAGAAGRDRRAGAGAPPRSAAPGPHRAPAPGAGASARRAAAGAGAADMEVLEAPGAAVRAPRTGRAKTGIRPRRPCPLSLYLLALAAPPPPPGFEAECNAVECLAGAAVASRARPRARPTAPASSPPQAPRRAAAASPPPPPANAEAAAVAACLSLYSSHLATLRAVAADPATDDDARAAPAADERAAFKLLLATFTALNQVRRAGDVPGVAAGQAFPTRGALAAIGLHNDWKHRLCVARPAGGSAAAAQPAAGEGLGGASAAPPSAPLFSASPPSSPLPPNAPFGVALLLPFGDGRAVPTNSGGGFVFFGGEREAVLRTNEARAIPVRLITARARGAGYTYHGLYDVVSIDAVADAPGPRSLRFTLRPQAGAPAPPAPTAAAAAAAAAAGGRVLRARRPAQRPPSPPPAPPPRRASAKRAATASAVAAAALLRPGLLDADIANGAEALPVPCFNEVDDALPPGTSAAKVLSLRQRLLTMRAVAAAAPRRARAPPLPPLPPRCQLSDAALAAAAAAAVASPVPSPAFIYLPTGPAGVLLAPNVTPSPPPTSGCGCAGDCSEAEWACACAARNRAKRLSYVDIADERARTPRPCLASARPAVFECGPDCGCPPSCINRVTQQGLRHALEVFRTSDGRGWGVRSPNPIPSGGFIGTFSGVMMADDDADGLRDADYIFNARVATNRTVFGPLGDIPLPRFSAGAGRRPPRAAVRHTLSPDQRAAASRVLAALRAAVHPDTREPIGHVIAHAPTRRENAKYARAIRYPIDLASIEAHLATKASYRSPWDFAYAIELALTNAQKWHAAGSAGHAAAEALRDIHRAAHRAEFGAGALLPPPHALDAGVNAVFLPDVPPDPDAAAEEAAAEAAAAGEGADGATVHEDEVDTAFCVDGFASGGITRFMNHSCEPNVFVQPVVGASNDDRERCGIAFFASHIVEPGTELTYDYGEQYLDRLKVCRCGAAACIKPLVPQAEGEAAAAGGAAVGGAAAVGPFTLPARKKRTPPPSPDTDAAAAVAAP